MSGIALGLISCMQVVNESVYFKKVFRPLGLGLGLVPLEAEATYTRPRPLKTGLEAESRPRGLTSLNLGIPKVIMFFDVKYLENGTR